jgi:hypothetical protein
VSPIGRRQVCADASIMAAAGVDIYKVSRWMGHASISTTDAISRTYFPPITDPYALPDGSMINMSWTGYNCGVGLGDTPNCPPLPRVM